MIKKYKYLLVGIVLLITVLVALPVIWVLHNPAAPPLPTPNGYDSFAMAGKEVTQDVGDYKELDHQSLVTLMQSNAEALRLLREGLTRKCLVPVDSILADPMGVTGELAGMKHVAQLLAAEGRLKELENRPAEAAHSYADAIRFGNEMSRGGLLITRLVGVACESIGTHALAKMVTKLTPEQSREVLHELEKIDAERTTWSEVMRSEKRCVRYHIRHQLNPIIWVVGWWNTRKAVEKSEIRLNTVIAQERLLMSELALRCYLTETGSAPKQLTELATKYLAKLPQDPFGNGPMIYRCESPTTWVVYSVGPDGVDDGGRALSRGQNVKGDILADSP